MWVPEWCRREGVYPITSQDRQALKQRSLATDVEQAGTDSVPVLNPYKLRQEGQPAWKMFQSKHVDNDSLWRPLMGAAERMDGGIVWGRVVYKQIEYMVYF